MKQFSIRFILIWTTFVAIMLVFSLSYGAYHGCGMAIFSTVLLSQIFVYRKIPVSCFVGLLVGLSAGLCLVESPGDYRYAGSIAIFCIFGASVAGSIQFTFGKFRLLGLAMLFFNLISYYILGTYGVKWFANLELEFWHWWRGVP